MRLSKVATWLALGRFLQTATAMILPVILVRTITQDEYGLFKQLDLAASLLAPLLILGFDKSITYFVPRRDSRPADEISTPILAMLAVALLVIPFGVLFPRVFGEVFGTAGLPLLVLAALVYAISAALLQMVSRALVAGEAARTAAVLPVVLGVPRTAGLAVIALFFPSLFLILWAVIFFAAVDVVAVLAVLYWKKFFRFSLRLPTLKRQFNYGVTLGVASTAQTWANRIDRYLISGAWSPAMFAVYAVGTTKIPFLFIFSQTIGDATAPRYSRLESEERHEEMAILWRTSAQTLLPLSLLVSVFLCVTAHWSIPLVFTNAYAAAIPIFQVWAFSILLRAFVGLDLILRALAALRFLFITTLLSLGVRVILGIAVLQTGVLALQAAVQLLISFGLLLVHLAYIRRRLQVSWTTLAPVQGLGFSLMLSVAGMLLTLLAAQWVGDLPLAAMLISGAFWGVLALIVLWHQGLWEKIFAPRNARAEERACT